MYYCYYLFQLYVMLGFCLQIAKCIWYPPTFVTATDDAARRGRGSDGDASCPPQLKQPEFSTHICTWFLPISMKQTRVESTYTHTNTVLFLQKKMHTQKRWFLYCGICRELRCFLQEGFYKWRRWGQDVKSTRLQTAAPTLKTLKNVNIGYFIEL